MEKFNDQLELRGDEFEDAMQHAPERSLTEEDLDEWYEETYEERWERMLREDKDIFRIS